MNFDGLTDRQLADRYRRLFCPVMTEALSLRAKLLDADRWGELETKSFGSACEVMASLVSLSYSMTTEMSEAKQESAQ